MPWLNNLEQMSHQTAQVAGDRNTLWLIYAKEIERGGKEKGGSEEGRRKRKRREGKERIYPQMWGNSGIEMESCSNGGNLKSLVSLWQKLIHILFICGHYQCLYYYFQILCSRRVSEKSCFILWMKSQVTLSDRHARL